MLFEKCCLPRQLLFYIGFEVAFSPVFYFFYRFKFFLFVFLVLLTEVTVVGTTGVFFVGLFPVSHGKSEGRFLSPLNLSFESFFGERR